MNIIQGWFDSLLNMLQSVFLGDVVTSVIAVVIAVVAGMVMKQYDSILRVTGLAVGAFFIGLFFYVAIQSPGDILQRADIGLNTVLGYTLGRVLIYYIAFLAVISVVYVVRSITVKK